MLPGIEARTEAERETEIAVVFFGTIAGAVVLAVTVAGVDGIEPALVGAMNGPIAALMAGRVATKKLEESFSKFHTYLILLGTSLLGLGLGSLLGVLRHL
jgi:serine/threonine-protein kinase